MGGKKKAVQQPRVKGNSKPSSSDKAARFLVQQTGGLETPLTNFLSTKPRSFLLDIDTSKVEGCQRRLSSFVPLRQNPDASGLDASVFNILKRLEKRDSVTKQKALREFCEILKPELDNNDNNVLMMNSILSVLPFWPRIYYRLSFDGDRKVRELVQSTMHALASRVGSDTILCVKQVIPMWTCSTVDTHESAASLAMRGLSDIFPGKKLSAAYCLCAEELLDLVETQLSDLGCFKFTDTKSYSRSKHSLDSRNNSVQNDGNNTANANTESYSSYSCDLSLILRFIALFVSDLIHLPADNKQLIRLKSLLSPEDIWSRVTHGLEAMSHEKNNSCLYRTYGTPSSLYIAVYKLCSVLCRSPIWCEWMKETSDGKVLGEYICNITVGHLGANCEQAGKTGTDKLLRFPAPRDVSADVYSSLWDAALSCLAGLSGKFVWSVIDWHQTFVTRLESLLSHSEKSQTKQAYTHLLCLLNEFPLDYSNLTSCELGILNKVFIEATLSGLQRSLLILMPVLNSGCSESGYTLSDDPDTPVYIVTGILESVRYLIDRLLTPMDDEKRDEVILARKMFSKIVVRLLSDCLITHTRADTSPRLICSRTALSRQSYLNVVFSQIAKFCNNLAQSNHCLKSSMYDELKSSIYHWISVDESEEFIPPINDECRVNRLLIGLTDPLRLISFMDSLARSSNQRMNKYFLDNSKMPTKKIDNNVDQCVVTLTVQADWCINLFRCIGDILLNNMAERIPKESSTRSFYILLFLCIYGHLPLKCFTVPCILQEVFSSLLPKLPHEVHCICWSHPVIYGLVKSWALSTENIENELNIPMNSSVCLIFTNDILPILMQSLPCLQKMFDSAGVSTKLLSNRISETLCFWARVWFNKISGTEHVVPNTIVINAYMNNLHSLLTSCLHNNKSICKSHREVNSNRNLSEAVIIPIQLVDTLSNCLKQRFENLLSSDYPFYSNNDNNNNKIDATELRIAGSLLIHLLQEVGNDDDDSLCNSSALSQLYLLLTKILLFLYNLSVLSEVSKTPPIGTEHRDGCAQNDDDDINEYTETVFTFKELIHRSEGVILNRLNYEKASDWHEESFFNQLTNVIFTNTAYSKWITPLFCHFVSSIYSSVCDDKHHSVVSSVANFSRLWLKYLVKHVNVVLEAVVNAYPLPNLYFTSRHLLREYRLCPLSVLPSLGELIRLHQLGLLLHLHVHLVSCGNELVVNQYLLCLGFIRVWLSSFCEPWDLCTDFGWTSEQTISNVSEVNSQIKHHLEPAMSAFEKTGVLLTRKLGYLWHEITANYPLSLLVNLSSSNVLGSITPLESPSYLVLHLTMNLLLVNRLRTVHPSFWPQEIKCAAMCKDDENQNSTWVELYLPFNSSSDVNYSNKLSFNKCIELYLPVGIIHRCLPRQELLGLLKSFSSLLGDCDLSNVNNSCLKVHSYVAELISSLVNIRLSAPIYLTTFSSIMLDDYRMWLTNLADVVTEDKSLCSQSPEVFNACLSTMSYLECLLLLWQPWQWSVLESEKSPLSVRLGLIQLSMRMRQLRPSLSMQQWDFILCLTVSWVCESVQYFCESSKSGSEKTVHDLLAFRTFRMAAALGAIFVERYSYLPLSDCIILKENSSSKTVIQPGNVEENDEIEDEELGNEFLDEEENAKQFSYSPCVSGKDSEDILTESFNIEFDEELDTDVTQMGVEEDTDLDDEEYMFSVFAKGLPLIPRRGEAPVTVRNDWEKFFAGNLYSTFLPLVLQSCIPLENRKSQALIDTDIHIRALCAAFATCPADHLINTFTIQPALTLEFLGEVQLKTDHSCAHQLLPSKNSSVYNLTSGFRASLDMACKLITYSPHQSGQLLGHILLNRLFGMRVLQGKNKASVSIANYLIRRIPTSWTSTLCGVLPPSVEKYLESELAADNWGRGNSSLSHLIDLSASGWTLNCQSHQALLGYLLAWDSLLSLMTGAGPQTRALLQSALLNSSAFMLDRFILVIGLLLPPSGNLEDYSNHASRLEPDERLLLINSASRMYLTAALTAFSRRHNRRPANLMEPVACGDDREWRDVFSPDDPLLQIPGHRVACDINHFAVRLFRRFLSDAPGLIRAWHTQLTSSSPSQDINSQISPLANHRPGRLRQLAGTIDKVVSKYFSPSLARDEVVLVQYRSYLRLLNKERTSSKSLFSLLKNTAEAGSVRIKSRPLSREVIATYFVDDEHSMEMIVQLPDNYPLNPVTVSKGRSVGVGSQQWQSWLLQMSVFINNHDGSILGGVDLWQRNVRKRFDGVEECAICYSIVHSTNFSLPKMNCHTCRKLFHYACMYKWFTTSRNPVCPLCRHLFFDPTGRPVST